MAQTDVENFGLDQRWKKWTDKWLSTGSTMGDLQSTYSLMKAPPLGPANKLKITHLILVSWSAPKGEYWEGPAFLWLPHMRLDS